MARLKKYRPIITAIIVVAIIVTASIFIFFKPIVIKSYKPVVANSFDPPGKGSDGFKEPTGLAWDGEYLWIADSTSEKIYKVDPYGQVNSRVMFIYRIEVIELIDAQAVIVTTAIIAVIVIVFFYFLYVSPRRKR